MAADQDISIGTYIDPLRSRTATTHSDPGHLTAFPSTHPSYSNYPRNLIKSSAYGQTSMTNPIMTPVNPVNIAGPSGPVDTCGGAGNAASINAGLSGSINAATQHATQLDANADWNMDPYRRHQAYTDPRYYPSPQFDANPHYQQHFSHKGSTFHDLNEHGAISPNKYIDHYHSLKPKNSGNPSILKGPQIPLNAPMHIPSTGHYPKDMRRKERHRRTKSRQKPLELAKNLENNNSTTLIAPAFVPGMPANSNHSGPPISEKPPGGFYWALLSRTAPDEDGYSNLDDEGTIITLPIQMCEPPLKKIVPAYPQALEGDPEPRTRKQSKYTAEQDKLILKLKDEGKSWADIAAEVNCHNQLAARNRYQVLIGQQGGGTFFWTSEDCDAFQSLLDEGERAKWLFIAQELSKKSNRKFTIDMVHYKICELFSQTPEMFNILKTRDPTRGGAPYKRKLL